MPRPSPRLSVAAAARQRIGKQLTQVLHRLEKAAAAAPDQPEPIHRLRVATRRARAAIELFRPVLPDKQADWFLKKLRKLRKAADRARNLDVFTRRIGEQSEEVPERVVELLRRQRAEAQLPLVKLSRDLVTGKRWQQKQRVLLHKIAARKSNTTLGKEPLKSFAPQALTPLIVAFMRSLAPPDRSAAQLHRLRVAGKKLRYGIEIVEAVLPKRSSTSVLAQLEKLQEVLGDLNDLATAANLMDELLEETSKRSTRRWLKAQRKRERVAFSEARAKFLRTWSERERQKWHNWFERVSPNGTAARNAAPTE